MQYQLTENKTYPTDHGHIQHSGMRKLRRVYATLPVLAVMSVCLAAGSRNISAAQEVSLGGDASANTVAGEVAETLDVTADVCEEKVPDLSYALTEEESEGLVSASYSILLPAGEEHVSLLENIPVVPDEQSVLAVPENQIFFAASADEDASQWIELSAVYSGQDPDASGSEAGNVYTTGTIAFAKYASYMQHMVNVSEAYSFSEVSFTYEDGTVRILSAKRKNDEMRFETDGNRIGTGEYAAFYGLYRYKLPVYNKERGLWPCGQWGEGTSGSIPYFWYTESDICIVPLPLTELNGDICCQYTLVYEDGSVRATDLIRSEARSGKQAELKTDHGAMTFSLFDDHASILKYMGTDRVVRIPETVNSLPVTEIGPYAFNGSTQGDVLTEVYIPENVLAIGEKAFYDCSALQTLRLPDTLEVIGRCAFESCDLMEVTVPASVQEIGDAAFGGCRNLTMEVDSASGACQVIDGLLMTKDGKRVIAWTAQAGEHVSIPEGTEEIGSGAFLNTPVRDVILPDSLKSIGIMAFAMCSDMNCPDLPEGLETIGDAAMEFQIYYWMGGKVAYDTTVRIGPALQKIGTNAFEFAGIRAFEVDGDNPVFSSKEGMLLTGDGTELIACPDPNEGQIVVPDGVIRTRADAFSMVEDGATLVIPDSVETIEELPEELSGFAAGARLKEWDPADVRYADMVEIPESNPYYCIEDGVIFDKDKTILYCYLSTKTETFYKIPDTVEQITDMAFRNGSLETLELSSSLIRLSEVEKGNEDWLYGNGGIAFSYLPSLMAYEGKSEALTTENGLLYSADGAILYDCPENIGLSVEVRNGTEVIATGAFSGYWDYTGSFKEIVLPETVTTIYSSNFYGGYEEADGQIDIYLPDSLNLIAAENFESCYNLVFHCSEGSYAAFCAEKYGVCFETEDGVHEAPSNETEADSFTTEDGLTLEENGTYLVDADPYIAGELTVPDGVVRIAEDAFEDCEYLTRLVLPDSVEVIESESISYRSFYSNLEYLYVGSGLRDWAPADDGVGQTGKVEISDANPYYCVVDHAIYNGDMTELICYSGARPQRSFEIPEGVTQIAEHAFDNLDYDTRKRLTELTIPASLTDLTQISSVRTNGIAEALREFGNLQYLNVVKGNPSYQSIDGLLYSADGKTLVACPCGRIGDVYVSEGTETIADGAFGGEVKVWSVIFPDGLTTIGDDNFTDVEGVLDLYLPESLEYIDGNSLVAGGYSGYTVFPGLTVHCLQGTKAEEFCVRSGVHYVAE